MALGAAFAIAVALTIAGVLAAIISTRTIPTSGTIRGVNLSIYWDAGFTNATSSCEWGTLDNGTSLNRTIYVRNTGTDSMTLSMAASNWSPSNATNALTLTWDKAGAVVVANSYVVANLTLSVDPGFTTGMSFSVDITITGTH
jgi:hypothetical protein